jgi:hypothetical protein
MRAMNNSVTRKLRGGCSLSVLDRGEEGQKKKCLSNIGRAEKGTKKGGGAREKGLLILKFQEKRNAFYRTAI